MPLEPEEQAIAEVLFQLEAPISLKDIPLEQLATMIANVRVELESAVEPALVAQHFLWLAPGLTLSSWSLLAGVYSHFDLFRNRFGIGLILIPAFYSLVSVLAIIKTIPATFLKLKSHLLGSRARGPLPFVKQDLRIIYLVLMAVACVAMMGWIVSWPLALQLAILVTMCAIASLAFRTPTAQGYKLLDQLEDFCSFLAEVDGDRLNRANSPRNSSPSAEDRVPWALALGIDHSWGEQFSAAVMNLAGLEESLDDLEANLPEQPAPEPEPEILDLNLK